MLTVSHGQRPLVAGLAGDEFETGAARIDGLRRMRLWSGIVQLRERGRRERLHGGAVLDWIKGAKE